MVISNNTKNNKMWREKKKKGYKIEEWDQLHTSSTTTTLTAGTIMG